MLLLSFFVSSKGSELRLGLAACASCHMQSFIVANREAACCRSRLSVVCDKACLMYHSHTSMGCGVQDGRRAHITLHCLIGRLPRPAAGPLCLGGSFPALLSAPPAPAAAPLLACTVPSQDTHSSVRIHTATQQTSKRRATSADARLADETAPVWTHTSRACCGPDPCLPRVMGCRCRVMGWMFYIALQA